MADEPTATEEPTPTPAAAEHIPAAPSPEGAEPAAAEPAEVHAVVRPLGEEFPITDHQSIAAKFKAKLEHLVFEIETDAAAGVHKLKGWLSGAH